MVLIRILGITLTFFLICSRANAADYIFKIIAAEAPEKIYQMTCMEQKKICSVTFDIFPSKACPETGIHMNFNVRDEIIEGNFSCRNHSFSTSGQGYETFYEEYKDIVDGGASLNLYKTNLSFEGERNIYAVIRPPNKPVASFALFVQKTNKN